MELLILGGTRFLGRHLVEAALERGHAVTMFNRGQTGVALFPGVERIRGDRDGGLDALAGRHWDAVVDTCGFLPRVVGASARRLADAVDHYTFISSLSVYAEPMPQDSDESAKVATIPDPAAEAFTGASYGPLKALCERAAEAAMPGRVLQVRAGLIVGPYDYTDRFPYWARRLDRAGEVLAPGKADQPVQWIDARDMAAWVVRMAEGRHAGTFNVTGPLQAYSLSRFLEEGKRALGSDAMLTWVGADFLTAQGVEPWSEMPLWAPGDGGFLRVSIARARAAGLALRPLAETMRDTLVWDLARPAGTPRSTTTIPTPASLTPEREVQLLRLWKASATL